MAASGWFATRPPGTEDVHEIDAENFKGEAHLDAVVREAQAIVNSAMDRRRAV